MKKVIIYTFCILLLVLLSLNLNPSYSFFKGEVLLSQSEPVGFNSLCNPVPIWGLGTKGWPIAFYNKTIKQSDSHTVYCSPGTKTSWNPTALIIDFAIFIILGFGLNKFLKRKQSML